MRSSACFACRQRKSRCKIEAGAVTTCLMCRSHGTACRFPPNTPRHRRDGLRNQHRAARSERTGTPQADVDAQRHHQSALHRRTARRTLHSPTPSDSVERLVGPIFGSDTQVVSGIAPEQRDGRHRGIRTVLTDPADPIVFTRTRRRPVNLKSMSNSDMRGFDVIQRLLEPFLPKLLDIFMTRVNPCLPLFDENDVQKTSDGGLTLATHFSPATLACLYANAMAFWSSDQNLASQHKPDHRFVWNLASETLYSEIRTNPSMHTVVAILLTVAGRPSTLVFNNAGLLGFAINMAFTFGLHRNPSSWDLPEHEKRLRMRIWWSLLIHDRWSSLAYGIPPRIRAEHVDAPPPGLGVSFDGCTILADSEPVRNFMALFGLTEVLYDYLNVIHDLRNPRFSSHQILKAKLHSWAQSTRSDQRKIILRGSDLSAPGAAMLRLAYLSVQFLQSRVELEHQRQARASGEAVSLLDLHSKARETAEEIALFVGELSIRQLQDFWLPVAGNFISSVMAFLLRSAVEPEDDVTAGSCDNVALQIATELMNSLVKHQDSTDWDIGDACITQYGDVLEKLNTVDSGKILEDAESQFLNDFLLQDDFLDPMFPIN